MLSLSPVFSFFSQKLSKTNQKNSKELYREAAQMLGMSCEFTENCRCLDCQVNENLFYFLSWICFSKKHFEINLLTIRKNLLKNAFNLKHEPLDFKVKITDNLSVLIFFCSEPIFWLWWWRRFRNIFKYLFRHRERGIFYTCWKQWHTLLL